MGKLDKILLSRAILTKTVLGAAEIGRASCRERV